MLFEKWGHVERKSVQSGEKDTSWTISLKALAPKPSSSRDIASIDNNSTVHDQKWCQIKVFERQRTQLCMHALEHSKCAWTYASKSAHLHAPTHIRRYTDTQQKPLQSSTLPSSHEFCSSFPLNSHGAGLNSKLAAAVPAPPPASPFISIDWCSTLSSSPTNHQLRVSCSNVKVIKHIIKGASSPVEDSQSWECACTATIFWRLQTLWPVYTHAISFTRFLTL